MEFPWGRIWWELTQPTQKSPVISNQASEELETDEAESTIISIIDETLLGNNTESLAANVTAPSIGNETKANSSEEVHEKPSKTFTLRRKVDKDREDGEEEYEDRDEKKSVDKCRRLSREELKERLREADGFNPAFMAATPMEAGRQFLPTYPSAHAFVQVSETPS